MKDRPNLPKEPLLIASYEKAEGTERYGPYVNISVSALTGRKQPEGITFKARLDTGADATVVPYEYVRELQPLLKAKPKLFRLGGQKAKRCNMYMVIVSLYGDSGVRTFRPADGVLLCENPIGLLGMDILRYLDVRFCNDKVYIYPQTGGDK